jgi:hypothetical protein
MISAPSPAALYAAGDTDIISVQSISKYLDGYGDVFDIDVRKAVTSTNDALKEAAVQGGRKGRS